MSTPRTAHPVIVLAGADCSTARASVLAALHPDDAFALSAARLPCGHAPVALTPNRAQRRAARGSR